MECAWPVRGVLTADQRDVRHEANKLRRLHAWRAIAMAVVVALLTFGGWTLKDGAIDVAAVLPSGLPTPTE